MAANDALPEVPLFVALTTYLGYAVLISFGLFREACAKLSGRSRYSQELCQSDGLGRLTDGWAAFYTRRLYHRLQDVFNRPLSGRPGAYIQVLERESPDGMKSMRIKEPRQTRRLMNLSSYNYLGFGDDWQESCSHAVLPALKKYPVGMCSSRCDLGTSTYHAEREKEVATFLGKEDAIVLNMGYGTNATVLPALLGKGDLVLSDEKNHSSIVNGCRASGAHIRRFRHNDASALEGVLRECIAFGQPSTRLRWERVLVVIEGIYSMEGTIARLADISRICKKYGAYLYLDEAHSIGALGPTGRGVTEHFGVPTADVDIMMGTFTKSFAGMGGYIAADKVVIDKLRVECAGMIQHSAMSPVVAAQVLQALRIIMDKDPEKEGLGRKKIEALRRNSNMLRSGLVKDGMQILGEQDSPIIPIMLYNPSKIAAFSRECKARGLAMTVVGFPATEVIASRARICVSAAHTTDDIRKALYILSAAADKVKMRYAVSPVG